MVKKEFEGRGNQDLQVSFDTPGKMASLESKAINLFLYDIRENRELRNPDRFVERRFDTDQNKYSAIVRYPPIRVDCSYMITAWAQTTETEHSLLGEVMQVLLSYPVIPEKFALDEDDMAMLPLNTVVLQQGHLQSLGEFWQALGVNLKAAINYSVTISVASRLSEVTGPLVIDKQIPGPRKKENECLNTRE